MCFVYSVRLLLRTLLRFAVRSWVCDSGTVQGGSEASRPHRHTFMEMPCCRRVQSAQGGLSYAPVLTLRPVQRYVPLRCAVERKRAENAAAFLPARSPSTCADANSTRRQPSPSINVRRCGPSLPGRRGRGRRCHTSRWSEGGAQ